MIKRQFTFTIKFLLGFMLLYSGHYSQAQDLDPQDSLMVLPSDSVVDVYVSENMEVALTEDTVALDSIPPKKFVSGVEFKVDYGKLLLMWTEFESKYEVGINVRFFERIVLNTEFGGAELNPLKAYDNALYYSIKGMYGRVGLDYYTSYDPSNFYYVGLRYGMSTFEDEGMFLLDSEYWPDYEEGFGSHDITASWMEIVLGTETFLKIGKKARETGKSKLLLGWNARLRILTDFENRVEPRIYAIPGYGRTFNNVAAALNFYIKYRIGS